MRIFGSVKSHETRARTHTSVSFRVIHAHPRLSVRQRDRSIARRAHTRTGHTAAVPGFRVRLVLNNAIASRRTWSRAGRLPKTPKRQSSRSFTHHVQLARGRARRTASPCANRAARAIANRKSLVDVRLAMALCLTYSRVGERDGARRARGGFEPCDGVCDTLVARSTHLGDDD